MKRTISKLALCALTLSIAAPAQAWSWQDFFGQAACSFTAVAGACIGAAFFSKREAQSEYRSWREGLIVLKNQVEAYAEIRVFPTFLFQEDHHEFQEMIEALSKAINEYSSMRSHVHDEDQQEALKKKVIEPCDAFIHYLETHKRRYHLSQALISGGLAALCGITYAWLKK